MRSRASTASFVLFVIVLLGAIYWLLHQHGKANWGLVAVLLGVLVLRGGLFLVNLRQQRRNTERGQGPVQIETRLGINDDPSADVAETRPSSSQDNRQP